MSRRPAPGGRDAGAETPAEFLRSLRRRVVIAIAAKLALIAALYLIFFSPPHRPRIDDAQVDRFLLPPR
ncbi:cytochrome oxidase putative small subunit CydP [Lysobacter sp. CCNWLW3]|uniref:cytochrome oxidase putative small subunit CydP n=1 Tax=unclassified Lysobacter TaxID=2635362 RepID=UPI002FD38A40